MKVLPIDSSPAEPGLFAGVHILAIDDDPAMRKLVADYLSGNDLRVTAVATRTRSNRSTSRPSAVPATSSACPSTRSIESSLHKIV
jgi:DNA-binding NtrC family response regulator